MSQFKVKIISTLKDLNFSSSDWNNLIPKMFPFQRMEFHQALLNSQCISPEQGQKAYYICVYEGSQIMGILPSFLKSHSYGEYLFDWQWANHFQMNNIRYYPKLVAYTPFTPIIGPKFLVSDSENSKVIMELLLSSFMELAEELNCFSASLLYPTLQESDFLSNQDKYFMRKRINFQFNWKNQDYNDFDHFLSLLKKNKRKNLKKERLSLDFLNLKTVSSNQLLDHVDLFNSCYINTIDKKYSHAYLNQAFFSEIFRTMPDNILLHEAIEDNETIAYSLSLYDEFEVYGRYWGNVKDIANLHFELCYYQNIDFAIKNNLKRVQAGAQGTHKIARGFLPDEVCSFHFFLHPQINDSIQNYILDENKQILEDGHDLFQHSPFKNP